MAFRFRFWARPRGPGGALPSWFFRRIRGAGPAVLASPVRIFFGVPSVAVLAFGPGVGGAWPVAVSFSVPSVTAVPYLASVAILQKANVKFGVPAVTATAPPIAVAIVVPVATVFSVPVVTVPGLGPELIVNGNFDLNADHWTLDNMLWGSARITNDFFGVPCGAQQNSVSFSDANTYRVSVDVIARGGTTWIQFNGVNTQQITTTGVQTWDLVPASTGLFSIVATGITAALTLDTISVRQVT